MKQIRQMTAVIEREGDGYVALCPELDIASQGNTIEQARQNLVEAVELFLETADPAEIQQHAEGEVPLEQIINEWPVGTDPAIHVEAINKLFESGATIVNIHSGQLDQKKVIEFYASSVLPKLGTRS